MSSWKRGQGGQDKGDHYKKPGQDLPSKMSNLNIGESSKGKGREVAGLINDVNNDMDELKKFANKIRSVKCHKCQASLETTNLLPHVEKWSRDAADSKSNAVISAIACSKSGCGATTCLGCGKKPTAGREKVMAKNIHLDWCCNSGRVVALWMSLCFFDHEKLIDDKPTSSPAQPKTPKFDVYGQPIQSSGTGYASLFDSAYKTGRSDQFVQFKGADRQADSRNEQIIVVIRKLCPAPSSEAERSFDKDPPAAVASCLGLSMMLDLVNELLRNDSVEDAMKRSGIFLAALELTEKLSRNTATKHLVKEERYVKQKTPGLMKLTWEGASGLKVASGSDSKVASIGRGMTNLTAVADTMIGGAQAMPQAYKDQMTTIDLCKRVSVVADRIVPSKPKATDADSLEEQWRKYQIRKKIDWVDDNTLTNRYTYRNDMHFTGTILPARMRRLVSEVSLLRTSLPEGIFARVATSRPDVMKVLIQGPDGTPYAGGLFEFDVLCPAGFPVEPPKIWLPVAPRHRVVLNPNLHMDGKVCLSLINTWPGDKSEQWQPNESRLLSVFISIQSMIFVEDPFQNIPGAEEDPGQESRRMRAEYETKVLKYGVVAWLTDSAMRDGIWSSVVKEYFRTNARKILDLANKAVQNGNPYLKRPVSEISSHPKGVYGELEDALRPFLKG